MKNLIFATVLVFLGAFAFAATTTNQAPQKLSEAEMADVIGGSSCISITCETWYWCGADLCGSNCQVSPCDIQ